MLNCVVVKSVYGANPVYLRKYLGVSHMSGMSESILFILWFETD